MPPDLQSLDPEKLFHAANLLSNMLLPKPLNKENKELLKNGIYLLLILSVITPLPLSESLKLNSSVWPLLRHVVLIKRWKGSNQDIETEETLNIQSGKYTRKRAQISSR
jgi:hypothetical protein